jgi:hypothetical protein
MLDSSGTVKELLIKESPTEGASELGRKLATAGAVFS